MSPDLMTACSALAASHADERVTGPVVFLVAGPIDIVWSPDRLPVIRGVIDAVVDTAAARLASRDPALAIVDALVSMSRRMDDSGDPTRGLNGLARMLDAIPSWSPIDAMPLARSIADAIEDPHVGGALGRRWLRDGLVEAAAIVPTIAQAQLAVSMTRVGDTWQTLAKHLRDDVTDGQINTEQTGRYALGVQTFEETFHARVLDVFGSDPDH